MTDGEFCMEKNCKESNRISPVTVFCKNNRPLSEHGVSFHWWNAKTTTLHTHDYCEIFIVTAGEVVHTFNGERYVLGRGALHFIKDNDVHKIEASKEKGCVHMNFCVRNDKLEKILDVLNIDKNDFFATEPLKTDLSAEELGSFINEAEKINLMNLDDTSRSTALICELVIRAVALLYASRRNISPSYPKWFSAILEKIHSPENIGIEVCDVYAMGEFSPPVMIKYFKQYTGKTVNAYLRDMKCEHACTLLETTRLSTLDISMALGYYSLSHFNRIFKEYTGMSPATYRKKYRDELPKTETL